MELSLSPKPEARNAFGAAEKRREKGKRKEKCASHQILGGLPWSEGPLSPRTGKLFSRDQNRPKPLESNGLRPACRFFPNRSLSGFGLRTATYQRGAVVLCDGPSTLSFCLHKDIEDEHETDFDASRAARPGDDGGGGGNDGGWDDLPGGNSAVEPDGDHQLNAVVPKTAIGVPQVLIRMRRRGY